MNWKTIKTFLIFLFLAVNIFLLAINYKSYTMAKLSDRAINDTLSLLSKNNIKIDSSVIPRDSADFDNIQLTNLYYSITAMPYKSSMKFTDSGNVELSLSAKNIPDDKSDLSEYIIKSLSVYGFDTGNIEIKKNGNEYELTYKVNRLPVFNNHMTVTVENNILKLAGTWYVNEKESTYTKGSAGHIYATSALTELISYTSENSDRPLTITSIDTGYYADVSQGAENIKIISASPCYRLTTDTNKVYYYSITDSKFIN